MSPGPQESTRKDTKKQKKKGAQRPPSVPAATGIPLDLADRIAAGEVAQSKSANGDELNGFHKVSWTDHG